MSTDQGWIKLHRKIEDSPLWQYMNSKQRDVFMQILLMANFTEKEWIWKGEVYHCKPGEFISSLPKIKERCAPDVSIQNIRTTLLLLKKFKFLTNHSTKTGRLISILNWEKYQGQPTDQPTDSQQTANRQPTAKKNDKNDKNDINTTTSVVVSPGETLWFGLWVEVMKFPITKEPKKNENTLRKLIADHGSDRVKQSLMVVGYAKSRKGRDKPYWCRYITSYIKINHFWDQIQAYATEQVMEQIGESADYQSFFN